MSARANPVRIGGFVVGAVVLVVGGLIVFGGGQLFESTTSYVAYFEGSVNGLQAGAPVSVRGVPIGQVTSVEVEYDPNNQDVRIPVYFETVRGTIRLVDPSPELSAADIPEQISKLIDRGLRARLAPLSFVTGQLYVELAFLPDTPDQRVGSDPDLIEIPTAPSQFEVLETRLESLLGTGRDEAGVRGIADRINELLSNDNLAEIHRMLTNLADFSSALGASKGDVTAILADIRQTLARLDEIAGSVERLTAGGGSVDGLITDLSGASSAITRVADQINNAVAENRPGIENFTDGTLYDVDGLVLDLEELARKLNRIADQLERDPSGFLFGGEPSGGIRAR
jgi:paraquat-inducible protein B